MLAEDFATMIECIELYRESINRLSVRLEDFAQSLGTDMCEDMIAGLKEGLDIMGGVKESWDTVLNLDAPLFANVRQFLEHNKAAIIWLDR